MNIKKINIANGAIFILIGIFSIWLWIAKGLYVVSHSYNRAGEMVTYTMSDQITIWFNLSEISQTVILAFISFFFIAWGVFTISAWKKNDKRGESA